jgi:hypothetical protein
MLPQLKGKSKRIWKDNIKLKPKQVTTPTARRMFLLEEVIGKEFEKY